MKLQILRAYQQYKEQLALVVYLLAVIILAPQFAQLVGLAWENSQLTLALANLVILVGLGSEVVVFSFIGLLIGLLGLMTIDPKKRWPALLLWVGFGIVVYFLLSAGQLLPQSFATDTLVWIVPGIIVGFVFGGGLQALRLSSIGPTEFRRGTWGVYALVSLVVIISLIEIHVEYPQFLQVGSENFTIILPQDLGVGFNADGIAVNAGIGLLSIVTVRKFMQYDAQEEFFILGPPSSGKSLLLIGAYLEALKRGDDKNVRQRESLDPSQDLMELIENLDRDASDWIVEATGRSELRDLRFKYVRGSLFPKNVNISSVDYAGEHLSRIPASLKGEIENPDEELSLITEGIEAADTLILLVDVERFVNKEGLGLAEYFSILEAAGNKGVVIVATKSDIFADAMWEEQEIDPQQSFGEFRQYVEDQLCQSEQFSSLLRQSPGSEVHPVYYETEFNDEGERVPVRDENGSVVTVGFDRLLNRLG